MLNVSSADRDSSDDTSVETSYTDVPPSRPSRLSLDPPLINPWRGIKAIERKSNRTQIDHAGPLSPLRDLDLEIMADWFERPEINEIEADIDYHLELLYPEPPWEDAIDFEFLHDHL